MSGRQMTSRIAVSKETHDQVKQFVDGLGVTYDEAILFLLQKVTHEDETPKQAGYRLRVEIDPDLR